MTTGRGPAIADAVVSELNNAGRPWNGSFTAVRSWMPIYKPSDLSSLRVSVAAMLVRTAVEKKSRKPQVQYTYRVDIDLQQMVTPNAQGLFDNATIDPLDLIAEQILDFYEDAHYLASPTNGGSLVWKVMEANRGDLFDLTEAATNLTWESMIQLEVTGIL